MKKLLLSLFCCVTTLGLAQISASVTPDKGCPNTTHDIQLTVTNNQMSIPAGFTYTVTLNVKNEGGTIVKTFSQTYSDGFAVGTSKNYTIEDIAFTAAATWTIDGSATVTGFGTFPVPAQNYVVESPADVIITENPQNHITTNVIPAGCEINFYQNESFIANTDDGVYDITMPGDYSAKAVRYVYSTGEGDDLECLSENFSNIVVAIATDIKEGQEVAVAVYPNPVATSIQLQTGLTAELNYDLTDSRGTVVQTGSFHGTHQIQMETLKAGSYVLVIRNQNEKVASYKLVK